MTVSPTDSYHNPNDLGGKFDFTSSFLGCFFVNSIGMIFIY